jgi:hypothetical protein
VRSPGHDGDASHRDSAVSPTAIAWGATAVVVPLILALVSSIGTIDLTYHLRTGAAIVSERAIPTIDTYTFSVAGHPWVDQQWGAQVVFHATYSVGGWEGLLTLQGVLAAAGFAFVYLAARNGGASARLASVLTLAGFLLSYPTITLRPQLLALPLFGAALWILSRRDRRPRLLWLLPVLAAITSNLHGSFVMFPLLAGLAWLDDVVEHRPGNRVLLIVTVVTAVATLVNPFGIGAWRYAIGLSTDPVIRESITEWAPLTLGTTLGAVTIGSLIAIIAYLGRRTRPAPWIPMLTIAIFFLLALSASRGVLWWGMVAPVMMATIFGRSFPGASPANDPPPREREPRGPALLVVGGLLIGAIVLLPWWRGVPLEQVEAAPVGITRALADLPSGSRIFAHQPWGSWIIFAVPDVPVFVDSRIEIMAQDVWEDYFQVAFAGARWRSVLDEWHPDAIVAAKGEWDLIPILRADDSWEVLYEDDDGVIFVPAAQP